jgi:hypothetical protein
LHESVGWELGHNEASPEGCRLRTVSKAFGLPSRKVAHTAKA